MPKEMLVLPKGFSREGRELFQKLVESGVDDDLRLAIWAWVSRIEGAIYSLRLSGLLRPVEEEEADA